MMPADQAQNSCVVTITTQPLTIRKATAEDSPQIGSLFQTTYGKSSHPCKDAQYVRGCICSGGTAWRVAVDGDRLIACVTLIINAWNRSWELARAVTLPEYRGSGIGTEMMQRSVDDACASSTCDVIVGFPRSRTMLHIVSESLKPALFPVGHDGAINVANSVREYHAVAFAPNPAARFRHYSPDSPSLADTEFVRNEIFGPIGLSPQRGEYPPQWVAGDGIEHSDSKLFSFRYDPFCPSEAIEITGYNADSRDAGQVASELFMMLDSFHHARHARLLVLADKGALIHRLVDAGFEATAYLPAWYLHRNARYDCILMVRGCFSQEPTDHGIRDVVDHFRQGLG
jgi:GNAT superfamily N-acetyltransferase